jgi:hypothetical protein
VHLADSFCQRFNAGEGFHNEGVGQIALVNEGNLTLAHAPDSSVVYAVDQH